MNTWGKIILALALTTMLALGLASLACTQCQTPNPLLPLGRQGPGVSLDPSSPEWADAYDIILDAPRRR